VVLVVLLILIFILKSKSQVVRVGVQEQVQEQGCPLAGHANGNNDGGLHPLRAPPNSTMATTDDGAAKSNAKKVALVVPVQKGVCVVCGAAVLNTQERDTNEAGEYYHTNAADCSGIAVTTV
jgi:hypothetical protein